MLKETQFQVVQKQLKDHGHVSRNWCLQQYITRLGAIMCVFKKNGVKFSAGYYDNPSGEGKDYIYILRK